MEWKYGAPARALSRRAFAGGTISSLVRLGAGCGESRGARDPIVGPLGTAEPDVGTDPSGMRVDLPSRIEHVLFITIDDLNDYVGFMGGHPSGYSPNLDRFASNSVAFMNAHCAVPTCNGSRTALMTGMRPTTTGIYRNENPWFPVLGDSPTIPSAFRDSGFRTVGAGKLFHGNAMQPRAWSDYFPALCDARPDDPSPAVLPANGVEGSGRMDWGPLSDDEVMGDEQVVSWMAEQFEAHDGASTAYFCGLFRPHLPWYVPLRYYELFDEDDVELPLVFEDDVDDVPEIAYEVFRRFGDHERIVSADAWREAVHGYLACVAFADAMFGRLIDALDASPLAERTAVVVCSDHGWHLGEKLHWRKFSLWEEATRVPLLIRLPGVPARRVRDPASLLDLFPTLAELFDLRGTDHVEGASLVPLLLDTNARREGGVITSWDRGNHSVRGERFRFTRYEDGSEELYDHDVDPNEWVNLAADPDHAAVVRELSAQLEEGVPPAPTDADYPPGELGCEVPGGE